MDRRLFLIKLDINIPWRWNFKILNAAWMKQSTSKMSTDAEIATKLFFYHIHEQFVCSM